ncbi:hypothetical protein CHN50_10035 [Priestia aryabhattai]|uniref:hypothetical protein n=1 Tax=Bacillaceae TaxID=186817 RepID=UPI000BA0B506|nr:hypothetical protein [Bacillus sp. CBEL-1]OZT12761.1 hypothetical protein CHN50_10035 [Priestia aryabhattai]TDB53781.1 hypothetical protein EPL02_05180 [Bacillus sp. CBEL-1]
MKPVKIIKSMKTVQSVQSVQFMQPMQLVQPVRRMQPTNHPQPKKDSNATTKHKVEGTLYMVGTDFVDILKDDCTVVTILRNNMSKIIWLDKVKKTSTTNHNSAYRSTHSKHFHYPCHCHRHGHHHNCTCKKKHHHNKKFHPTPSIPACGGMVQLRLGGLTQNLNFHLFKKIGKRVIIECSSH